MFTSHQVVTSHTPCHLPPCTPHHCMQQWSTMLQFAHSQCGGTCRAAEQAAIVLLTMAATAGVAAQTAHQRCSSSNNMEHGTADNYTKHVPCRPCATHLTMPASAHMMLLSSARLAAIHAAAARDNCLGAATPGPDAPTDRSALAHCCEASSAWAMDGATARLANTSPSRRELLASLLAPCRPVQATCMRHTEVASP